MDKFCFPKIGSKCSRDVLYKNSDRSVQGTLGSRDFVIKGRYDQEHNVQKSLTPRDVLDKGHHVQGT